MTKLKTTILILMLAGFTSCSFSKTSSSESRKLRHVVAFKFKPEITVEQMQQVTTAFYALKADIPEIIEFEGGPDINIQKKQGKYTHSFMVTVKDEKALGIYGAHPKHKAFSRLADPMLAEVMVVDYWTE